MHVRAVRRCRHPNEIFICFGLELTALIYYTTTRAMAQRMGRGERDITFGANMDGMNM